MSWHYLQAGEVASWDPSCSDGVPSALSRLIPTAGKYYFRGKEMDASNHFLFGTILKHLKADSGADTSISSRADSRTAPNGGSRRAL